MITYCVYYKDNFKLYKTTYQCKRYHYTSKCDMLKVLVHDDCVLLESLEWLHY